MWVFGYGSLIWNPDFPIAETRLARASGWQRSFCMHSIHYRGSLAAPGLVLALDRDAAGFCDGLAFRVTSGAEDSTLQLLRARELISSAYLERQISLSTSQGPLQALAYVIDPGHVQYCGKLSLEAQAQIIATAVGERGANRDYLWATTARLAALGIADAELDWLSERVQTLSGAITKPEG